MRVSFPIAAAIAIVSECLLLSGAETTSAPSAASAAAPASAPAPAPAPAPVRNFVKDYFADEDLTEFAKRVNVSLRGGRNFAQGKELFTSLSCVLCHHFDGGEGGIGPVLSGVGGRFGAVDLLTAIIDPNHDVSDLFGMTKIYTKDGKTVVGRWINRDDPDNYDLVPTFGIDTATMTAAWNLPPTRVPVSNVDEVDPQQVSPMPYGLLNNLHENEIEDLAAYLISDGDPNNKMFKPLPPAPPATPDPKSAPAAAPAKK